MSEPEIASDNKSGRRLLLGYISVLGAAALFGSAFTMAKPPLEKIDSLFLSAIVYVISGISLIPFAGISLKVNKKDLVRLIVVSCLGAAIAPFLLFYGLKITPASDASILTNGEVIFTIILSSLFFGEKPKGRRGIFSVLLVVIGLFMATTNLQISNTIFEYRLGNIMILASMFVWAVDNNISRVLTKNPNLKPAQIAMIKSLAGGLILLGICVATGTKMAMDISLLPIVVALASFGFGAALLLFLEGLKRIGTVKTMVMFSLTPVFGITIASIVLHESVTAIQIIATAIIIAGIYIISRS